MKQCRCPHCNHRIFDISDELFGNIRIICRRCKKHICFAFPSVAKQPE